MKSPEELKKLQERMRRRKERLQKQKEKEKKKERLWKARSAYLRWIREKPHEVALSRLRGKRNLRSVSLTRKPSPMERVSLKERSSLGIY